MLGRLFTGVVRPKVASSSSRSFSGVPIAPHPIEEQFYVTPRINGELPMPGMINVRVLTTHIVTATSILALWALNRHTRAIPVEMQKVTIANPETGAEENFLKPVGVFSQTDAIKRSYPGYEIVQAASPTRKTSREASVISAIQLYNHQMDCYANGDTSFIGTTTQLFFPDRAFVDTPLDVPNKTSN